jgi:CBS domain-containing protein
MDPVEFLRQHEPFSRLGTEGVERIEQTLEVAYAPRGTRVLGRLDERNPYLWIVRKGAVRLEAEGRAVDLLAEGELFGFASAIAGAAPRFDVVADEDTLLYRVPEETFHELLRQSGPTSCGRWRTGCAWRPSASPCPPRGT